MKHVNLSVPGGQGLDGTGLVEMKRAELKEVEGGGCFAEMFEVNEGFVIYEECTFGGRTTIRNYWGDFDGNYLGYNEW